MRRRRQSSRGAPQDGASVTTDTDPAITRFSSDKKIDYYVTNDVSSTGSMRRKADKISDHMIIELPWRTEKKYQDCTVTLEPVPKWHNPGMMPTSEWRMMISNTWIDSPKWPEYIHLMQVIEAPIKTQEEIDEQFTRCVQLVDRLMRGVFQIRAQQLQELIDDPRQSVETVQQAMVVKRAIDKNLKRRVIKGAAREGKLTRGWKQVQTSQRKRSVMDDTYMRKKHAKWIGRAIQLQRLIKNKGMDNTRRDPQGHDLLSKLFTTAEIREGKVEELLQQRLKAKNELITKYEKLPQANSDDEMERSHAILGGGSLEMDSEEVSARDVAPCRVHQPQ